jgi:hypothetical protein
LENEIPLEFQAAVDYRFFEKHEYHALTPDQKNMLRLKRLKRGHVGKGRTGNGNGNGKNSGKGATIKSLTRSIAALSTKTDKFSLPDDDHDEDESSDEEEGTSNLSNAALTRQSKKISQCALDLLTVWKKLTNQTLIHMQILVFVEKRF